MLSGILNSDRAIAVNIQIMRIFTRIRQMFMDNTDIYLEIEKIKNKLLYIREVLRFVQKTIFKIAAADGYFVTDGKGNVLNTKKDY